MTRNVFLRLGVLAVSALQAGAETILYQEDFSSFQNGSELLRVVESKHPDFPRALELRSIKQKDGKIRQGNWQVPLKEIGAIPESGTLEIRFWMKPATESARYGLLVNDKGYKAITFIQDNGFFQVPKSPGWGWEKTAACKIGQWHQILYRINSQRGMFDVFVDDMAKPAVRDMPFRDPQAVFINRIWTLGSESAESQTLFGPIKVSLTYPEEFPPEALQGSPCYLKGVGWTAPAPGPEAFARSVPLALGSAAGQVKEAARLSLLRDRENLYCLFRLDARDMAKRSGEAGARDGKVWADDCFELFIRPDPRQDTYYHLAGNSSGALYDAKHQQPGSRDDAWNCRWSSRIGRDGHGWTALVTVPFAELGCASPSNAAWGFAAGRENPHAGETLSWTVPERFGTLYFPAEHDPRSVKLRMADAMDACYEFPYRFKDLSEKLQGELPFPHRILSQTLQQLREKLKALMQARADAASFREFLSVEADLQQLTVGQEALLQKAGQMASFFKPGSEGRRRGYVACVESSMTKVRDSYCGSPSTGASLLLSGNEYGSFQVVLLSPTGKELKGVKVSVPPLHDPAGNILEKTRQNAFLVEDVRTAMPKRTAEYYPDVLRPGTDFRFEDRARVTLWFDLYLPAGTPAGTYQTRIEICPEGREACVVPVAVEATGLTLPPSASLDTAFCFAEAWVREFYGKKTPAEKMRNYCQFILEHRLEPMNLWSGGEIDIGTDVLDYCAGHGKTMLFLPVGNLRRNQGKYQALIEKYQGRLRPVFFGHDEVLMQNSPEKLANMQRDYSAAKELFPAVPRLNTAPVDKRLFGYVDIWCPLFFHYSAVDSAERLRLGEKVWWYPTDYPLAPYANFNLDSPGIDPRIIPWMNWKLNISGLLYWGLNREWLTNTPKEIERLTPAFIKERSIDWLTPEEAKKIGASGSRWPEQPWLPYFRSVNDERSVSATNGGGNLLYPGPDWEPWPSLRLKNLRDGMQDYEYFVLLKKNVAALKTKNPKHPALPAAEKVLAIDDDVVGAATRYTQDPHRLLSFRQELIRLVVETGATPPAVQSGRGPRQR